MDSSNNSDEDSFLDNFQTEGSNVPGAKNSSSPTFKQSRNKNTPCATPETLKLSRKKSTNVLCLTPKNTISQKNQCREKNSKKRYSLLKTLCRSNLTPKLKVVTPNQTKKIKQYTTPKNITLKSSKVKISTSKKVKDNTSNKKSKIKRKFNNSFKRYSSRLNSSLNRIGRRMRNNNSYLNWSISYNINRSGKKRIVSSAKIVKHRKRKPACPSPNESIDSGTPLSNFVSNSNTTCKFFDGTVISPIINKCKSQLPHIAEIKNTLKKKNLVGKLYIIIIYNKYYVILK